MKIIKKLTCLFFTIIIMITCIDINVFEAKVIKYYGLNTNLPTQTDIAKLAKKTTYTNNLGDNSTYSNPPRYVEPHYSGTVSKVYLKDGIDTLNLVRYIAGLNANITVSKKYQKLAQDAVFLTTLNSSALSHSPSQPTAISDALYASGYEGASKSNLAMGYTFLSTAIMGYLGDYDTDNIKTLGHRRWILNPSMGKTGFGIANIFNGVSAMYVFDFSNSKNTTNNEIVAWPTKNTPITMFTPDYPFSLSLGSNFDNVNRNKITITMTRHKDNKTWTFNKKTSNKPTSQSYFGTSNNTMGQPHCIIWRPDGIDEYKVGDKFTITIKGVTKKGVSYPIKYTSTLFNLDKAVKKLSAS